MKTHFIWIFLLSFIMSMGVQAQLQSMTQAESIGSIRREFHSLKLSNGKVIKVITDDLPVISRLRPILFVIPAKKYLGQAEIFEKLALKAAKTGVYVVRFDWSFSFDGLTTAQERNLAMSDIQAVFDSAIVQQPMLDQSKVLILAKSFGATIYSEEFQSKKIKSLYLLTPNCDQQNTFERRFLPIFKLQLPVRAAISVDDPYCDVKQMREFEVKYPNPKHIFAYFTGDHNFSGPGNSVDAVVNSLFQWATEN